MRTLTVQDWFSNGHWEYTGRPREVYRKLHGWARLGIRFGLCAGLWHVDGRIVAMVRAQGGGFAPLRVW